MFMVIPDMDCQSDGAVWTRHFLDMVPPGGAPPLSDWAIL